TPDGSGGRGGSGAPANQRAGELQDGSSGGGAIPGSDLAHDRLSARPKGWLVSRLGGRRRGPPALRRGQGGREVGGAGSPSAAGGALGSKARRSVRGAHLFSGRLGSAAAARRILAIAIRDFVG